MLLAEAAWKRGLYRDAARLWKNAVTQGHWKAPLSLVEHLHALYPDDPGPARHAVRHAALDDPSRIALLLQTLKRVGADEQFTALADRAAGHAPSTARTVLMTY